MRETWTFHTAGQLLFGRNAVRQLGEIAGRLGARRVLLVTDQILVRAGVADRVRAPLAESGAAVETFDGGEPEPSLRAADACTAAITSATTRCPAPSCRWSACRPRRAPARK
jgi:alcohol dehydrogenase class IV